MHKPTPPPADERAPATPRRLALAWALALALGIAALSPFDRALYHGSNAFKESFDSTLREPVAMCRVAGYVPVWWLIALAAWLAARGESRRGGSAAPSRLRVASLAIAPALAGLSAEVFKLLVRRLRPSKTDGEHVFKAFDGALLDGRGLGFPSSESAVAFAAMFVLYRAFPRAWPVWLVFAAGSAFSRMYEGKHFATDVYAGALVGIACAVFVCARVERRRAAR
jgi:undecaprenyl-diphosphatase